MLSKKKKIFILVGMLVLLVVTGYVNVLLNQKAVDSLKEGAVQSDFFATYRVDRQTTRDQTFLYLTAIIDSETASAEAKQEAEQQQLQLTAVSNLELALEANIKAKGFEDCIVTAGTKNINVLVKKAELTEDEMIQILSVVTSESEQKPSNIKIVPVG